jgi:putative heme-binding domain-containing protein
LKDSRAAEIALQSLEHPSDYYLDYGLKETMTTLEPYWKTALTSGKPFNLKGAGAAFLLGSVTPAELSKMPRSTPVYLALLSRDGVLPQFREEALSGLASINKSDYVSELFTAIERIDKGGAGHSDHVLHDLGHLLTARDAKELAKFRPRLEKIAVAARMPLTRQVAYVALMTADNSVDRVWADASKNLFTFRDLVEAVPIVPDSKLRAATYPKVKLLLNGLPDDLAKLAQASKGTVGRFVRIELPGNGKTLSLAEVEVFSGGVNVARNGKATQANTSHGGVASRAIDGNKSGTYADGGQTHSVEGTKNPWWEVDLGREVPIESIAIYNRSENVLGARLAGFKLTVLDMHRKPVFTRENQPAPPTSVTFTLDSDFASAIRLAAINAVATIPGVEAEAFASLAGIIQQGKDRDAAVRALRRIPKNLWPKDQLEPLAKSIVAYASKLSPEQRADTDALDALQLGNDVAALLGPQGKELSALLGKLGVQIVFIRTVPHNMIFDVAEFTVEAGRPVVVVLDNTDIMPHNLIIGAPGSLTELGTLAEKMANDTSAFAKGFVPDSPKVLHASRLLQPREAERMKIVAPKEPGRYVFVCTFPGHWPVMNGVMKVVANLDEVPASDRVKYLENKKWAIAELTPHLDQLDAGRSFERGKELFKMRSCNQCHQLNNEGGNLGPNLAELPKKLQSGKFSRADLLREVLEPSAVIDEKYRVVSLTLSSGLPVQGLIVHKDKDVVRIAKNAVEKPIEIKRSQIDEETVMDKISLMPAGLLDRLTRDDVLDLMAYIASGGDATHPSFRRKE